MKKSVFLLLAVISVSDVPVRTQTAEIVMRPAYVDVSSPSSKGAVLVKLSGYSSDDVRYRLYNGSNFYYCWNSSEGIYVSSNSYSAGPPAPGTPCASSQFWIMYLRGSNASAAVTYRDRLGPTYSVNYQTVNLPQAEEITTQFLLTGKFTGGESSPLTEKYVVLAWWGEKLISASHTEISTGSFSVACPAGTTIDKIEVRTLTDSKAGSITGSWNTDADVGEIFSGVQTGYKLIPDSRIKIYPVPVKDILYIEHEGLCNAIELYHITGRKISDFRLSGQFRDQVDLSDLLPAIYLIKLKTSNGDVVKKLIKY